MESEKKIIMSINQDYLMRRFHYLLSVFLLLSLAAFSQKPNLQDWKIDSLPIGSKWIKFNNSQTEFSFNIIGKKAEILKNNDHSKGENLPFSKEFMAVNLSKLTRIRSIMKVDKGYIVGINKGEFGGGLWFVSQSGDVAYELAKRLNIVKIFEYKSRIFAIEGLDHMGFPRGNVIEIYQDTTWKYKVLHRLTDAPYLIRRHNDHLIIVASGSIYKIDKNLKISTLLKAPFSWNMLFPSSVLFDQEDIYLAMRGGILKIAAFETKPMYEWYVPNP
jgi:hypothetical protein